MRVDDVELGSKHYVLRARGNYLGFFTNDKDILDIEYGDITTDFMLTLDKHEAFDLYFFLKRNFDFE